jgi:predicted phosphodiesterase
MSQAAQSILDTIFDAPDEPSGSLSSSAPEEEVAVLARRVPAAHRDPQRFLLLSDIHANWPALKAVLEHAQGSYDAIWFLGDVVSYGTHPLECLLFLRRCISSQRWRAGNHDLGLCDGLPPAEFADQARITLQMHRKLLLDEQPRLLDWFSRQVTAERNRPVVRRYGRGQMVFTHANLDGDTSYLFPARTFVTRANLFKLRRFLPDPAKSGWLLAGHTHVPCFFHLAVEAADYMDARPRSITWDEPADISEGHFYVNAGSVGQPRDGDPRACYCILDVDRLAVTWRRVPYDNAEVLDRIYRLGYPRMLADMIAAGGTADTMMELAPWYRRTERGLEAVALER